MKLRPISKIFKTDWGAQLTLLTVHCNKIIKSKINIEFTFFTHWSHYLNYTINHLYTLSCIMYISATVYSTYIIHYTALQSTSPPPPLNRTVVKLQFMFIALTTPVHCVCTSICRDALLRLTLGKQARVTTTAVWTATYTSGGEGGECMHTVPHRIQEILWLYLLFGRRKEMRYLRMVLVINDIR